LIVTAWRLYNEQVTGPANFDLQTFAWIITALLCGGGVLALILLAWVVVTIRRVELPEGADFWTALRATPLVVVILLDLLDLVLDIFSAPFAWVILGYLGLEPLRMVAVLEAFIPGTQFIPTLTLAWIAARLGVGLEA
jgi:hypothetical protein